jgi:hypothetical protein
LGSIYELWGGRWVTTEIVEGRVSAAGKDKENTTHKIVLFEEWCCNKGVGTFLDLAGLA